ncbi:MAG: tetratricopeptide repeat protein, partial [Ktedonobacterales bacterium]|nr:tetratricopeptide repeat protein [Ktedonobacterales bacterium]
GQVARQRGDGAQAAALLDDAVRRFEQQGRQARAATATLERARLALTRGELGTATHLVERGRELAHDSTQATGEPGPEAMAAAIAAMLALTLGQVEHARTFAAEAEARAAREGDGLAAVEAALQLAEVALAAEDLNAAVNGFNRAAALAREHEAGVAEGLAGVGLGRVLLRRGLFTEAANTLQEALAHFRSADDPAAQAMVYLALGDARRQLGDLDAARAAFTRAAQISARIESALGEAHAIRGEARTLLDMPELEAAIGRYARAMESVARVSGTINDADVRGVFFDTWAGLYAEAVYASARAANAPRALELAQAYGGRASQTGRARALQQLREFEQALPTKGADLTKEEVERNKVTGKILADARKALGR